MSNTIWPDLATAIQRSRQVARPPLTWDPITHLLSRFTFGATRADRAYVAKFGPDAWVANQLKLGQATPGYAGLSADVIRKIGPLLSASPAQLAPGGLAYTAMNQLSATTLAMQAYSPCQLYETLVDVFANHLNIVNRQDIVWASRHTFDRDVIRGNVLGNFTDMLVASAKHPAMLNYLGMAQSNKIAVNENYGRELLELHSVGLHYSQSDVTNASRLLTGRTLNYVTWDYIYNPAIHPLGPVRVLDFTTPNAVPGAGQDEGDALVRYLARHPYTAAMLAQKLCVRFVSETPSAELLTAVAKAYLDNNTQIWPMVSTILRSTEFWESRGLKTRRPAENVVATIRVLGVQPTDWVAGTLQLRWLLGQLGNVPLEWAPPNGYPDVAAAWRSSSAQLTAWTHHLDFAFGAVAGFAKADLGFVNDAKPATSGAALDALTKGLTGMVFNSTHRQVLQTFIGESANTPMSKSRLSMMLPPLAALVLNGPHHALR